ncbi:MAG: hypothetical protein EBU08_11280 [Micrococcales bacterium]|nr:hypothetical protein [Micrococcales bacterium]
MNYSNIDDLLKLDLSSLKETDLIEMQKQVSAIADQKCFQAGIEYNIRDVELIDRLEEKMKLIEMVYTLAFYAKVNFSDVFSQVRMWDVIIHNHLWNENIAIPLDVKSSNKDAAYEGAYVKEPQVGAHNNVMSFDLTSLYPHLIMQYNISPDTITNWKVDLSLDQFLDRDFDVQEFVAASDVCVAPNGWCFRKDKKGFLPTILEKMYEVRNLAKKKMIEAKKLLEAEEDPHEKKKYEKVVSRYKNLQLALKITLNSAYGAIGNPYFRFFDLRQATAITMGGQLTIRWAEAEINRYMNTICGTTNADYVIASDTDSLYISFDALVKKYPPKGAVVDFLDTIAQKKILPKFREIFEELAKRMNSYDQKMQMNRENIASRAIWTAKKRYMMNVLDSEGVRFETPDLKIMGLEAIKSSTPSSCREAIKHAMKIILAGTEDELHTNVAAFKKNFFTLPFEDIAFPRGVQGLTAYDLNSKSLPIHVRGALSYNSLLLNKKLTRR